MHHGASRSSEVGSVGRVDSTGRTVRRVRPQDVGSEPIHRTTKEDHGVPWSSAFTDTGLLYYFRISASAYILTIFHEPSACFSIVICAADFLSEGFVLAPDFSM